MKTILYKQRKQTFSTCVYVFIDTDNIFVCCNPIQCGYHRAKHIKPGLVMDTKNKFHIKHVQSIKHISGVEVKSSNNPMLHL